MGHHFLAGFAGGNNGWSKEEGADQGAADPKDSGKCVDEAKYNNKRIPGRLLSWCFTLCHELVKGEYLPVIRLAGIARIKNPAMSTPLHLRNSIAGHVPGGDRWGSQNEHCECNHAAPSERPKSNPRILSDIIMRLEIDGNARAALGFYSVAILLLGMEPGVRSLALKSSEYS